MAPQNVIVQLEAWRGKVSQQTMLLVNNARTQLIAAQTQANFATAETPSDDDYKVQERVNGALDELRDWHQRKIRSMIAQAQARELSATTSNVGGAQPAVAAPQAAARFCKNCGAPVS